MFILENENMPTKRGRKKARKETPLVSSIVVFQLLSLHVGKQESSLLAYVGHSERDASIYIMGFNVTRHQRHIETMPVGPV